MTPTRATLAAVFIAGAAAAIALVTKVESGPSQPLPSSSMRVSSAGAQAAPAAPVATSLQAAFVQVFKQVGPAVVSISTEQIEQVQRYFRGHPFFYGPGPQGSGDPFEEFFREFFGGAPQQEFKRFGLGSGVIIDEKGLILTNEHVVGEASKITVVLSDGREFDGEVKGKDPRSDLAVVKIDAKGLPAARLGDSDALEAGQWAIAVGNLFGLSGTGSPEPTLTVGVISATNRHLPRMGRGDRDYADLIQTDAVINPGNSGGPLVNIDGEVIGVNVAIITPTGVYAGAGFAIPINKAKAVLDQLIEGRKVLYGWLGIQIQDITQDVAEFYGLDNRDGVLVFQVLPDSPAEQAGMQDGDIMTTFDGKPIRNSRELISAVGQAEVGGTVKVEILRDHRRMTLNVEIGERPSETELAEGVSESWRGLRVTVLAPPLAEQFGLPPDATGVVVTDVEPGSPASDANLQPGDVINEINRQPIESLAEYREAIRRVEGNVLVRTMRGYVVIKAEP